MADPKIGATYPDAIIAALTFAREEPWIFLLTVPPTVFGLIIATLLWLRFVATGHIGLQRREYENVRLQHRKPKDPQLPL
jgi:hypothetical protein